MNAVAKVNNNTIVVVNTVGPIVVEAWIENPNGKSLTLGLVKTCRITFQ